LQLASAFGLRLRAATRFSLWLSAFLLVGLLPAFSLLRSLPTARAFTLPVAPAAQFSLHLPAYWAFALEAVWVLTSLLCLARLLVSGLEMRRLFVESELVDFRGLDSGLQALLTKRGRRTVALRLSDAVDAPSAIGFFRPAVVLPRSLWSELNPGELQQVVMHELAHLERGDDWTNLLQKLLRALWPLNPALLWAERNLCRERERACDDAVLETAGDARAYAGCLTKLAESRLVRRAAALAPGLWKHRSELVSRVDHILHPRRTLSPLFSRGLLAAGLLASVTGALLLQRCPGLIAFTADPAVAAPTSAQEVAIVPAALVHKHATAHAGRQADLADDALLPSAGYHDAVFHPAISRTPATVVKRRVAAAKHRTPNASSLYTGRPRLIDMSDAPAQSRAVFTVVVFTWQAPQSMPAPRLVLPLADLPTLSLSDNWIVFQI
jgi:beta-lactamase regulating signal transducer with metallopeptidase domain